MKKITCLEKRERGCIQGLPNFFVYPLLSQARGSYKCQIWPVYSDSPSEQKPIKNCGEKGAWAYPGTAQFFSGTPIISGRGKATNFKFCMHIYRLSWNKSPLKISGKVAVGVVRDSQKFSRHLYIGHIAWSSLRQLSFLVINSSRLEC